MIQIEDNGGMTNVCQIHSILSQIAEDAYEKLEDETDLETIIENITGITGVNNVSVQTELVSRREISRTSLA